MVQFFIGFLLGILMCIVIMMARCCIWFEKHHPEDDYWHRIKARAGREEIK